MGPARQGKGSAGRGSGMIAVVQKRAELKRRFQGEGKTAGQKATELYLED
jgi:hypothetical protein